MRDWLIWQIADSAFPAGAFAHSGGIEAAWQCGFLMDSSDLAGWIRASLRQIARGVGPFVACTCRAPQRFQEADQINDAFLSNHVANRASRAQGAAFLAAATRVFDPALALARKLGRDAQARPTLHFGPVFGLLSAQLDLEVPAACSMFLFMSLRSMISAAVRLGIVGPMQGQCIQADLSDDARRLVSLATALRLDELAQTMPLLDLAQANQDRLYSRLFQS